MDQVKADCGWRMADCADEKGEVQTVERLTERRRRKSAIRHPQSALGYLLAAAGLAWVLYDIEPGKLLDHIAGIDWWYVAAALACDVLCYTCQGWRWRLLLRPAGEITTLRATQAIYAGLFTNEVLPMRLGELLRGYLAAHWAGVKFLAVVPSMVTERLFDGVWLAVGVGLMAMFLPLPGRLQQTGDVVGLVMIAAIALFLFFILRRRTVATDEAPPRAHRRPLRQRAAAALNCLAEGLRAIGLTRSFYQAFALSLLFVTLEITAFWLVMWGYGLGLSFWAGAAVFFIIRLGTLIPNAPANVGAYQFFCVLGLKLFGVEKTVATGFSLVVFVLLTLPLLVIGFIAFSRSGATLCGVRDEVGKILNHQKEEAERS